MRTMTELRQYVSDRFAENKANQEAANARIAELEDAIKADKQAQRDAAAANDSEAYARVVTDESFHRAQLDQAYDAQKSPPFTPDELAALAIEVDEADRAFRAPIYKRMVELLDEGAALYNQISQANSAQYSIWSACVKLNGGACISMPSIHPAVKALFAPNSNSHLMHDFSDHLNK